MKPDVCNDLLHEMLAKVLMNAAHVNPEITGFITSEFVRQLEILVLAKTGHTFSPPMHKCSCFLPVVPEGSTARILFKVIPSPRISLAVWEVTSKQGRVEILP